MLETTARVVNSLGLHARAAAQLVRLSGRFKSTITVSRADNAEFADAKSMLEVLTLAASMDTILRLTAEGEDESAAIDAVRDLFKTGFGEL